MADGKPASTVVARARALRRKLTLPEGLLWRSLRTRPGGFKFRRQHPLGGYVLDFFCFEAAMAIEVDGMAHAMGANPQRDATRDGRLASHGIKTLRIPAAAVLNDMDSVVRLIVAECGGRSPSTAARSPSPAKAGEE